MAETLVCVPVSTNGAMVVKVAAGVPSATLVAMSTLEPGAKLASPE